MSSSDLTFLLIIVALIVVAIFIFMAMRKKRTDALRDKYGDEYDRTLDAHDSRDAAEDNLAEREERVKQYDLHPFSPEERERFNGEWQQVKSDFVDSPAEAVLHADRLLGNMMQTRGYPMADFDRHYEDLTVNHGDVARSYRSGHEVAENHGDATTEEMRRAFKDFENLFNHLMHDQSSVEDSRPVTSAATRPDTGPATTKR